MSFYDFITKIQENITKTQKKMDEFQQQINAFQQKIEENPTEALFKLKKPASKPVQKDETPKQSRTVKLIIKRFYSDYPEPPYISNDRPKDWIEKAETFPVLSIVPKTMMTRFSDGLLPGHVYMLHWLKKYTNKKVPAYFEYKYGIDFEKEKIYLCENGFLDDANKPTEKGEETISKHFEVIENHKTATEKPAPTIENISAQIIAQRDSIIANGFKRYEYIASRNSCEICSKLNGKHFSISKFEIGVNAPPMHEGCSCSIAAYSDREEYEKWLNSL